MSDSTPDVSAEMDAMPTTRQIPADAMRLRLGAAEFSAPEQADGKTTCKMVARSRHPVAHPFLGMPIYHDFAGMQRHRDRLPLDWCHDPHQLLGYVEGFGSAAGELACDGTVFSVRADDRAAEVLSRAAQGQPYECSIKFDDGVAEEISPGQETICNGMTVHGPALIFREWTLRGVALCPYGMDSRTAVQFSADDPTQSVTIRMVPREGQMTNDKELKDLAAENESLKVQVADLTKQLKALTDAVPADDQDKDKTAAEVREELSRQASEYVAKFGEQGAAWFAARKPLVECYGEYIAALNTRHAGELAAEKTRAEGLQGAVTELTARIEALGNQGGEPTPVTGGPAGGKDGAPDKAGEYANVLPKNLARLAAGIKLPHRA